MFLSYASQDVEAARRICEALRAAGIEVWFDQSELRGGDAWDRSIRRQIHDCALFVPIISAHSQARLEGYFRREWKLAADRTHDMAEEKAFLMPVVIDDTSEQVASVPGKFRDVQWTPLRGGETPAAFVERVQCLLSPQPSTSTRAPANAQSGSVGIIRAPVRAAGSPKRALLVAVGVVVLGAVAYFAIEKLWMAKPAVSSSTVAASAATATFAPPPTLGSSLAVRQYERRQGSGVLFRRADGGAPQLSD